VILIDTNLLLYAYDSRSERHAPAKNWLEGAFSGQERLGLPWAVVLAFLRLTTHTGVMTQPLNLAEAVAIVESWLERPNSGIVWPTERHWDVLREVLATGQARGALVTDAHLAALAIEHGAVLCSADRDFSRFPGLKWKNPLAA
jgi:toxin-antitoxin system PIN domain toxin